MAINVQSELRRPVRLRQPGDRGRDWRHPRTRSRRMGGCIGYGDHARSDRAGARRAITCTGRPSRLEREGRGPANAQLMPAPQLARFYGRSSRRPWTPELPAKPSQRICSVPTAASPLAPLPRGEDGSVLHGRHDTQKRCHTVCLDHRGEGLVGLPIRHEGLLPSGAATRR